MKGKIRILSFVICLIFVCSVFVACSGSKDVSTGGNYKYWVLLDGATGQTLKSYNDMMMYQEIEKRTGIKVDFVHPAAGSTGSEAFQILIASGDFPDMIEYNWSKYPGGAEQAINDGVIVPLNDYLKDYAPNYYSYLEGKNGDENNNLYKIQSMTESGNYYGFKNMNIGTYRGFCGLYIRGDLLKKWGLDIPVTIDDWTECFEVAKENGFSAPLTGSAGLFNTTGSEMFNTAWNVGKDFYLVNGNAKFGPFEKAYKDYVIKMAEWVKSGYVDVDCITNDTSMIEGYMTNGTSIATFGYVGSGMGRLLPAMAERDDKYSLVACPYPVLKKGDTPWFQEIQAESLSPEIAISVQCGIDNEDRYKEAVKWCDYLYSEEGSILKNFGIEGETFTVEKDEDGKEHYIYTDKIYDHEKIGAHSVEAALYHFMRPANTPGLNQHPDYLNGFYPFEQQKDAIKVWNKNIEEAKKHVFPTVNYTPEEATDIANIVARGQNNLNAGIFNIILGKASMDTYEDVINQAKKSGYDKYIKIQQDAYNRMYKN